MNGAEALVRTLVASGVEHVFTNPGSTEMEAIREFDAVPEFRPVLGLFEGVCTGAVDGYARMAGKPSATLLHVGPGTRSETAEDFTRQLEAALTEDGPRPVDAVMAD